MGDDDRARGDPGCGASLRHQQGPGRDRRDLDGRLRRAFHIAALDRHAFCAVGGHSAALWQSAGASAAGAFDDAADYRRNDVFAAARRGAYDHQRALWLDGGTDDPFRAAGAAFAALLRHRGVRVAYHVWPGGHTSSYWHAHTAAYLGFYAAALARCRL